MKKFISTVKNIFSIEDLRIRILNTIGFLVVFRLGSFIVLPGVDPSKLGDAPEGIFGLIDTFLGGAFSNASIFGLGIMPYISASIVLQLLTVGVPYFQKLQKEGESGRKRINQFTRVLTILITIAQGVGYITATILPTGAVMVSTTLFMFSSLVLLTAGTMFCMWLGEKITDKGIGNGISLIIMVGIIAQLPYGIFAEFATELTVKSIFEANTVALLAEVIEQAQPVQHGQLAQQVVRLAAIAEHAVQAVPPGRIGPGNRHAFMHRRPPPVGQQAERERTAGGLLRAVVRRTEIAQQRQLLQRGVELAGGLDPLHALHPRGQLGQSSGFAHASRAYQGDYAALFHRFLLRRFDRVS